MSQLSKNQRYTLLKFNSSIGNLTDIKNRVTKKIYKDPLHVKGVTYNPDNPETFFLFSWESVSDEFEVEIGLDSSEKEKIFYTKATAVCEYSTRRKKDDLNRLLPKEKRLNTQQTDVLFISVKGNIFAIVYTTDEYELKRIKSLINKDILDPLNTEYQMDPDIFTWLFYKYINDEFNIGNDITMHGITGFTGNILSDENKFKGDSESMPDLMITKAFLANKYSITAMRLDLNVEDSTTSFYVSENTSGNELGVAAKRGSSTNIILQPHDIYDTMPIYIYFCLIPEIFSNYEKEKAEFESSHKAKFLKKIGIEVIQMILARNNLTVNDIP